MRKYILLVVFISFATIGCAQLKQAVADGKLCWQDDTCRNEVVTKADKVKAEVTQVAGVASPVPWVPNVAGAVAGGAMVVVGLVIGGRKKREEAAK